MAVLVAIFVLALTGIGIVVAVPLAFGFAVVGGVGNALGYLALLDGPVADRRVALAVGAAVAGVASAVPLLGQLVGGVVVGIGLGGMARDYADSDGRGRAARRQ